MPDSEIGKFPYTYTFPAADVSSTQTVRNSTSLLSVVSPLVLPTPTVLGPQMFILPLVSTLSSGMQVVGIEIKTSAFNPAITPIITASAPANSSVGNLSISSASGPASSRSAIPASTITSTAVVPADTPKMTTIANQGSKATSPATVTPAPVATQSKGPKAFSVTRMISTICLVAVAVTVFL